MPEIRNCKKCGKIFTYLAGMTICPRCREEEEEEFKVIKKYLYENPGATVTEVATVLDISVKKIKRFLREGRLEILDDEGNLVLECEKCGSAIKSGRYCEECAKDVAFNLKKTASKLKHDLSTRKKEEFSLRYLHKDDKK